MVLILILLVAFPDEPQVIRSEILESFSVDDRKEISALKSWEQAYINRILRNERIGSDPNFDEGGTGDLFKARDAVAVSQIIDSSKFLGFGNRVMIEGLNTSGLNDGDAVSLSGAVMEVVGSYSYTTVLGANRTVRHVRLASTSSAKNFIEKTLKSQGYRAWGESTGNPVVAKFETSRGSRVYLHLPSGKRLIVPMNQITKADQDWIKKQ